MHYREKIEQYFKQCTVDNVIKSFYGNIQRQQDDEIRAIYGNGPIVRNGTNGLQNEDCNTLMPSVLICQHQITSKNCW